MQTELVGYIRKDKNGQNLRIHFSVEAMDSVSRHVNEQGDHCYFLVARLDKVEEVMCGEREVTSVVTDWEVP